MTFSRREAGAVGGLLGAGAGFVLGSFFGGALGDTLLPSKFDKFAATITATINYGSGEVPLTGPKKLYAIPASSTDSSNQGGGAYVFFGADGQTPQLYMEVRTGVFGKLVGTGTGTFTNVYLMNPTGSPVTATASGNSTTLSPQTISVLQFSPI